jgi:hypothetical protein
MKNWFSVIPWMAVATDKKLNCSTTRMTMQNLKAASCAGGLRSSDIVFSSKCFPMHFFEMFHILDIFRCIPKIIFSGKLFLKVTETI